MSLPPTTPPETDASSLSSAAVVDACWARIGVWANRQCPELVQAVHCRNCQVYANAAATMLDRPLPPGYREQWASHFAAPETADAAETSAAVIFRVGPEWFALPVSVLVEVVGRRPVRSLPHARSGFIKGLVNVRGRLVICISLTKALRLPERAAEEKALHLDSERLIVVSTPEGRLAFPVSEVHQVTRVNPAELRGVPATVIHGDGHVTRAVFTRSILRRDPDKSGTEQVHVGLLDEQALFRHISRSIS